MIVGTGVAAPEAGEIWHLLDQRLQMPVTKLDILNFSRADLSRYNTMIMVSGTYTLIDKAASDKIKAWVQGGNTLITLKSGTEWAIKNGLTKKNYCLLILPKQLLDAGTLIWLYILKELNQWVDQSFVLTWILHILLGLDLQTGQYLYIEMD